VADNRINLIIEALDKTQGAFASLKGKLVSAKGEVESFRLKTVDAARALEGFFGLAALYTGARFFGSAIDAAEQMEGSLRGLAAVARYSGEDIGASIQVASDLAADGLVNVADSSKALQNLLARGYKLDEAEAVLRRLKDAAAFNRQSHLTMSEAVVSATEGLKNENSILVDNAGVTKNVSVMWKEYAEKIGKGVQELTSAEKRQAEYNGIMQETEAQVGNAKLAAEGLTGAKARLRTEVFKLKTALGDSLTPAFYGIAKAANWVMQNAIIPFIAGIEILSTKLAALFTQSKLRNELADLERPLARLGQSAEWKTRADKRAKQIRYQLLLLEQDKDVQIREIMDKWQGALKIPNIGMDTGKRRPPEEPPAGGGKPGKTGKAATRADLFTDEQLGDLWIASELERYAETERLNEEWFQSEKKRLADAATAHEAYRSSMLQWEGEYTEAVRQNADSRERITEEEWEKRFGREAAFASPYASMTLALEEFAARAAEVGPRIYDAVSYAFSDLTDVLTEFCMTGKASFKDLADSIVRDLLRIAIRQNVTGPLAKGAATGIDALLTAWGTSALGYHTGGVPGRDAPTFYRVVPTAVFAHAPRYHGGVGPGEQAAIIRKDEGVFTPGQMRAMGILARGAAAAPEVGVEIVINNQSGTPVAAAQTQSGMRFDGRRYVKEIMIELAGSDRAVRSAFGVKGV